MILRLFTLLFVFSCTTTPETNRKALSLVPEQQMVQMGAQSYQEISSNEKVSTDPYLNELVTRVGTRIANASQMKMDWEFKVFAEPDTINAFCLPGGKIGVYTGILPVAQNEAGLAAILGHEVAHATAHHSTERVSQALLLNLGLGLAEINLNNSKYRGLILAALGVGAQVGVLLPYSRMHESEADEIGLTYMARAGYDPSEAAALWVRMGEAEKGARPPVFLSTHPRSQDRAEELRGLVPKVQSEYHNSQKQPSRPIRL